MLISAIRIFFYFIWSIRLYFYLYQFNIQNGFLLLTITVSFQHVRMSKDFLIFYSSYKLSIIIRQNLLNFVISQTFSNLDSLCNKRGLRENLHIGSFKLITPLLKFQQFNNRRVYNYCNPWHMRVENHVHFGTKIRIKRKIKHLLYFLLLYTIRDHLICIFECKEYIRLVRMQHYLDMVLKLNI